MSDAVCVDVCRCLVHNIENIFMRTFIPRRVGDDVDQVAAGLYAVEATLRKEYRERERERERERDTHTHTHTHTHTQKQRKREWLLLCSGRIEDSCLPGPILRMCVCLRERGRRVCVCV